MFNLVTKYKPSGDQPKAIKELVNGIKEGKITINQKPMYQAKTYT